jgi:hypothetical protein
MHEHQIANLTRFSRTGGTFARQQFDPSQLAPAPHARRLPPRHLPLRHAQRFRRRYDHRPRHRVQLEPLRTRRGIALLRLVWDLDAVPTGLDVGGKVTVQMIMVALADRL